MENFRNALEFGALCGLFGIPFIISLIYFEMFRHGFFKKGKDNQNNNDKSIKG